MKIFIITILAISGLYGYAQTAGNTQVKTANGTLQGVVESSGVRSFKGIPFAQAPVGKLRWVEPQPVQNWTGVRKADHFGPQAMQRPIYSDMIFRSDGKSEDCLYLNIWTPAKAGKAHLPVLVYFYGGGFTTGDGSEGRYDGESMAKKGIIAITVNYRLGVFGFLAHPELTQESAHHSSGNYGLMDQHAALVWVKTNISAFGGDPNRITIAGESAGSMSVSGQMASPLSKGLFARAIAESGALMGNLAPVPLTDAEQKGVQFATSIGVSSLADLRKLPADSLLKISARFKFPTTIDGYFLPKSPEDIFAAGEQMHVPLLAGWNSAESNYKTLMGDRPLTVEGYKATLQALYGEQYFDQAFAAYPVTTDADVMQVATEWASDSFIAYSTWKLTDLHSRTSSKPVYRYYYSRKRPAYADGRPNNPAGAVHSAEIEYAMGNLHYNKTYSWTPDDFKVSETMQNYFVNFINTGNPNGALKTRNPHVKEVPAWYSLQDNTPPQIMVIDVNSQSKPDNTVRRYQWLDAFGKRNKPSSK